MDPAWVMAIMRQESAFMPNARSPKGALGLMQIMPGTGRTIARSAFFTPTPSTWQNNSKNSRSIPLKNPTRRGVKRQKYCFVPRYLPTEPFLIAAAAVERHHQLVTGEQW